MVVSYAKYYGIPEYHLAVLLVYIYPNLIFRIVQLSGIGYQNKHKLALPTELAKPISYMKYTLLAQLGRFVGRGRRHAVNS